MLFHDSRRSLEACNMMIIRLIGIVFLNLAISPLAQAKPPGNYIYCVDIGVDADTLSTSITDFKYLSAYGLNNDDIHFNNDYIDELTSNNSSNAKAFWMKLHQSFKSMQIAHGYNKYGSNLNQLHAQCLFFDTLEAALESQRHNVLPANIDFSFFPSASASPSTIGSKKSSDNFTAGISTTGHFALEGLASSDTANSANVLSAKIIAKVVSGPFNGTDASKCVALGSEASGLYFNNKCDFPVHYVFCAKSQIDNPWQCGRNGRFAQGAGYIESRGKDFVVLIPDGSFLFWSACKLPSWPVNARELNNSMTFDCK